MKAAFIRAHGGLEALQFGDLPDPQCASGEIIVRVRAVALNHIDLWLRQGLPRLPVDMPHVCGADVTGEIAHVGAGVHGFQIGSKVVANPGLSCGRCQHCMDGRDNLCADYGLLGERCWGGEAECLALPAGNVVLAPDGVADEVLAATPVVYLTAWHMLVDRARLAPGQSVLVWGAGSGVGTAAIQIARLFGARIITTATGAQRQAQARALGADEVVDGRDPNLLQNLKDLTHGRGVDVVFEHPGAATINTSIRAVARGGCVVTCGATTGGQVPIDLRHIFWRQLSLLGATMAPRGCLPRILALVEKGKLNPVVHAVLPLSEIKEAHRLLESGGCFGKVVLKV